MRNFDPSILFVLFGVLFFAGMLDMPFLVIGFIFYMVYRSSKRKRQDPRDQRDYRREDRRYTRRYERPQTRQQERPRPKPKARPKRRAPKNNPYKTSGLKKFKDFDYKGAIEDFEKALQINPDDIAVHFNLACAYSLNEDVDKSLYHLDRAVSLGFKDVEKIQNHDALAYLRIQEKFEAFEQNNYRLTGAQRKSVKEEPGQNSELLEQLNKLAELRKKGLLTEEEYVMQKKKLTN